jgi:hypothetical protein
MAAPEIREMGSVAARYACAFATAIAATFTVSFVSLGGNWSRAFFSVRDFRNGCILCVLCLRLAQKSCAKQRGV